MPRLTLNATASALVLFVATGCGATQSGTEADGAFQGRHRLTEIAAPGATPTSASPTDSPTARDRRLIRDFSETHTHADHAHGCEEYAEDGASSATLAQEMVYSPEKDTLQIFRNGQEYLLTPADANCITGNDAVYSTVYGNQATFLGSLAADCDTFIELRAEHGTQGKATEDGMEWHLEGVDRFIMERCKEPFRSALLAGRN